LKIITDSSKNINKKRQALTQEGEGLGVVFSVLAPIIAKLLTKNG